MIKIRKQKYAPPILVTNQGKWTSDLLRAINKYGSYQKIPKNIKNELIKHYKHKDVKKYLFPTAITKCCFCECIPEEGGNIEVEHFFPKSIYPELIFEWDNLLPVCRKCNGKKSTLDTMKHSIVNPAKEDPEIYFKYDLIKIVPSNNCPDIDKATRTIRENNGLHLNQFRLLHPRGTLLAHLTSYENELEKFLTEYHSANTKIKKKNRIDKLQQSLDKIELLCHNGEKYAGFCRHFIKFSVPFGKAQKLIENFEGN